MKKIKDKISAFAPEQGIYTLGGEKDSVVFIRDIDELTTTEELLRCVKEQAEIKYPDRVMARSLKPASMGRQTTILTMEKEDARNLGTKSHVRVGLSSCRVEEKVQVKKCFRCWAFGHSVRDCTGQDRGNSCHKCGNKGHHKKDCKNLNPKCVLCELEGHETGGGGCIAFREALRDRKKGRRKQDNLPTQDTAQKILQIIMNRSRGAYDLAKAKTCKGRYDIIIK